MKLSFRESLKFSQVREDLFRGDESFRLFQYALMDNPYAGDVIRGTGGVRKVRWMAVEQGKGKRGGIRVLYLYQESKSRILLLWAYAKNELENPTPKQLKEISDMARAEKKEEDNEEQS